MNGIESVKKNAADAKVDDETGESTRQDSWLGPS